MRTKGAKTSKNCWNCKILNSHTEILNKDYKTLQDIASELELTYNQIVEISNGRKKQSQGKYGTKYYITKLSCDAIPEPEILFDEVGETQVKTEVSVE